MSATRRAGVLTASISVFASASGWCQSYPVKPVRLIIGGLPGTAPDVMARVIMPKVSESLGQPIVIDNRGGGAGLLGVQLTVAAPADAYTVLFVVVGGVSIVPFLTKKSPYDPVREARSAARPIQGRAAGRARHDQRPGAVRDHHHDPDPAARKGAAPAAAGRNQHQALGGVSGHPDRRGVRRAGLPSPTSGSPCSGLRRRRRQPPRSSTAKGAKRWIFRP